MDALKALATSFNVKNGQLTLRGLFLLTVVFAAISLGLAISRNGREVARMDNSRYMTMALFRLFDQAHQEHLASGGEPVIKVDDLEMLLSYLESRNWLTRHEGQAVVQFVCGKKDLTTDGFGNPIQIHRSEYGVFSFVSVGFDEKDTRDDIAHPFYAEWLSEE